MVPEQAIARARSQLGARTVYRSGGGKINPVSTDCRDELRSCDCSALLCWIYRINKYQGNEFWWLKELNGGWANTDGIWVDARGLENSGPEIMTGNFYEITSPRPACGVVYPAAWVSKTHGPRVGHCGIVTKVNDDGSYQVLHCSSGNYKRTGDAIQETSGKLFERIRSRIFVWPGSVKP
jgi:hypothetical protein